MPHVYGYVLILLPAFAHMLRVSLLSLFFSVLPSLSRARLISFDFTLEC